MSDLVKTKFTPLILLAMLLVVVGQFNKKIAFSIAGLILVGAIVFNIKNYTELLA